MSLFDSLTDKAEELAGKVGIPPEQVLAIASSIEAKTGDGSSQIDAIEAAAAEHGLPLDAIKQLVGHATGSNDISSEIGSAIGGFFKG